MKRIVLFLLLPVLCKAQTDSLCKRNADEIRYMKQCFYNAHEQHKRGKNLVVLGIGFASAAGVSYVVAPKSVGFFSFGSAVFCFTGTIVILKSHKWIGRAALEGDERYQFR